MNKQQEPRLRFKGFTGAWEEKVLGEVTEYLSDGTHFSPKSQNGEYKYITSKNIRNSGLDLSDVSYISAEEHQEIYKRCSVKFGDLLLTKDGASTGNCCINFLDEEFSLLSSVAVLRPKQKKHNANFLCQVLQSPIGQNEIKGSMAGQAITRITLEKLRAYKFNFPLYEEQTHLGLFFRRLDSQIAESRTVLEKSRQLKKAMLAKMFPANGEKIPKIRFKGFEGEWKTRSLRDVLEIERKGKAQYQKLQAGNVPYLDAEFLNGGVKILTDAVSDVDVNDILIIWDGSNAGKVYTGFNGVLGSTLKSYRTNADCSSMFLYQELVRNEEVIFSQYRTPNIPHVIKDFSDEYNFLMPSYTEQTAIGNFFRQLDETIALQSAEVEKLNRLKKGLLAAMLV